MTVDFRPIGTRVAVRRAEAETKTPGGILLPDNATEKPVKGTVFAVGAGSVDEPMEVAVGDAVFFGKWSGTELEIGGETILIMQQSDILGVLK